MDHFDLKEFIIGLIVIICSITLHEFGHAIAADRLGDPTPRRDGRISIWPDKHFEPFGFIMILITLSSGFGLGWGKPVMVNSRYFRNPSRDMLVVALAGPVMNLLQAIAGALVVRAMVASGSLAILIGAQGQPTTTSQFLSEIILINLSLMFFNLIPIPPLDGSKILAGLLPGDLAQSYMRIAGQYGGLLLLGLVFLGRGILTHMLGPAVDSTAQFLLGPASGVLFG